jgi:hypothetical protein
MRRFKVNEPAAPLCELCRRRGAERVAAYRISGSLIHDHFACNWCKEEWEKATRHWNNPALVGVLEVGGVAVGDTVRSYDFGPDRAPDIYVEGIVTGLVGLEGCTRYRIQVVRRIWEGRDVTGEDAPREVHPPVNGTPIAGGGACNYVKKV